MSLDLNTLANAMLTAMQTSLAGNWQAVATLAAGEAQKLAQTLVSIEAMTIAKSAPPDQLAILLDMQQHATRAVLMSVAGISILIAEQAINAGLAAVASTVNAAIGFKLI